MWGMNTLISWTVSQSISLCLSVIWHFTHNLKWHLLTLYWVMLACPYCSLASVCEIDFLLQCQLYITSTLLSPVWDCLIHCVGNSPGRCHRQTPGSGCVLLLNGGGVVNQMLILNPHPFLLENQTCWLHYKTYLDKWHEGEICTLSKVFSSSIFGFCKRKALKDEDELVDFENIHLVVRSTYVKCSTHLPPGPWIWDLLGLSATQWLRQSWTELDFT